MGEKHPDLFTGPEAAVYLHLVDSLTAAAKDDSWQRTLETFAAKGLPSQHMGRRVMYHREHLDLFVATQFAINAKRGFRELIRKGSAA